MIIITEGQTDNQETLLHADHLIDSEQASILAQILNMSEGTLRRVDGEYDTGSDDAGIKTIKPIQKWDTIKSLLSLCLLYNL